VLPPTVSCHAPTWQLWPHQWLILSQFIPVCETANRLAEQSYQMATIIVSIFDHSNNLVKKDATAMIDSQPGTITFTGRVYTALNVGDTYNLVAKDGKHASILVDWSSGNSSTFKFLSLCPW
jgi:hypothetical protein